MHNFFIWMKVCCTPANVGGSEKSRPWVCIGGSEKNRLWCVANGMSGIKTLELWVFKVTTFCMDTSMHAGFFATDRLHRPPGSAEIHPMSQRDASSVSRIGTRRVWKNENVNNKRLCYCRGTARRAMSVEILWPFFDWAIDKKLC